MAFKEGYIFRFYSETFQTNPEIKLDFLQKRNYFNPPTEEL